MFDIQTLLVLYKNYWHWNRLIDIKITHHVILTHWSHLTAGGHHILFNIQIVSWAQVVIFHCELNVFRLHWQSVIQVTSDIYSGNTWHSNGVRLCPVLYNWLYSFSVSWWHLHVPQKWSVDMWCWYFPSIWPCILHLVK